MIKEAYCSFEVAKLLKEKGFITPCDWLYCSNGFFGHRNSIWDKEMFPAPTHQMAMAWLREKGIAILPIISSVLDNEKFLWDIKVTVAKTCDTHFQGWVYEQYENAIDDALKYVLENLIQL